MYRKINITIIAICAVLTLGMGVAMAEQSSGVGAQSVNLNFAVNIPAVLFLRVGSAGGTIDTVTFNVTDIPENEPTVAGDVTPVLRVGAMTPATSTVTLTADSSTPLSDGGTGTMPFSQISYAASAPFSVLDTAFNGTTNQQIWQGTGPGFRDGTMNFVYTNSYSYGGNYTGQVTFTVASP
jgi:hypothetical protein